MPTPSEPIRIWFNRTFATTWHLIELLRANPENRPVQVISTHADLDSPVLAASDEQFAEPSLADDEYVEWALDFAARHRVDLLIPRAGMAALASARERFETVGTAVACPSANTVRLFEDKVAAYAAAAALGVPVPPHAVARTPDELRAAYDTFAAFGAVCMKPVSGVGGEGYRRLTDAPPTWDEYRGEVRSLVRVDDVCAAMGAASPEPLLVLPFLDGDEVSVDVLADADGTPVTMIGRLHGGGRRRVIVDDQEGFEVARTLTVAHRISYLSNTQIKYWQGPADSARRPYLLEVNTRAAGGLFHTTLAGVNLAWACVQVALGEQVELPAPVFGAVYTQLAALVRLDR
jgi:biotin carboxylase